MNLSGLSGPAGSSKGCRAQWKVAGDGPGTVEAAASEFKVRGIDPFDQAPGRGVVIGTVAHLSTGTVQSALVNVTTLAVSPAK